MNRLFSTAPKTGPTRRHFVGTTGAAAAFGAVAPSILVTGAGQRRGGQRLPLGRLPRHGGRRRLDGDPGVGQ